MCQCTPEIRTPFCGRPGCEWPGKPEGARKPFAPHQERVVVERDELSEKITKLSGFVNDNPVFTMLPSAEQDRLRRQFAIMRQHEDVLNERIVAF